MTGLRPVAELMFADFLSVGHDLVVNQIAKARYMTNGQITLPLVVRFGNGGGLRFGAQHSQSVEGWLMAVPGLKVVVPSTPADVIGLMAAAVRDDDPVMFLEEKALYSTSEEVPDGEHVDELGTARIRRSGSDVTIVALGTMVHRALGAAEQLAATGTDCEVIDLRSLVPLDVSSVAASVNKTGRLFTVEENPRLCGWGAEVASIIAEECFYDLDSPIRRITAPHIPLPAADSLEDATIPSVDRIVESVRRGLG
jgi:pyruvate dehydrogenase E1 component beta subunit